MRDMVNLPNCDSYPKDLGEPTRTLVPCWMPKPLPPKNQCTDWFAQPTQKMTPTFS